MPDTHRGGKKNVIQEDSSLDNNVKLAGLFTPIDTI